MPVETLIIGLAGLAVLVVTVYAALGRGGELSAERGDYAPLDLGPVSATDIALFRPSSAMWGYDMRITDEALERIATSIRERDVRIVALEQLVTDLSRDSAPIPPGSGPLPGARHRRPPAPPAPQTRFTPVSPPAHDTPPDPIVPPGADAPTDPEIPIVPEIQSFSGTLAAAPTSVPTSAPAQTPTPEPEREPVSAEDRAEAEESQPQPPPSPERFDD